MLTVSYTVGGNRQKKKIKERANASQQGRNGIVESSKETNTIIGEQDTKKGQNTVV